MQACNLLYICEIGATCGACLSGCSLLLSLSRRNRPAINTTTKQAFVPDHLSRQPLGPGQYVAFIPGPTASQASGGQWPFVLVGGTNRDKRVVFYPGWWLQPGQKTRVAFCPGWCLQPGQKTLAPLSPSLSPRPSHSAHLILAVLGSGERSSCSFLHHICEDL